MADIAELELFSEVFAKTPAAIIILDNRGFITKANDSALNMLGVDVLEGRRWFEVINEVFRPRQDDGQEISTRDGKRLQVSTKALSKGQLVQMTDLTVTRNLQDKISHMERLSSLGKMAASLAHQIRTPLSAAILYAANLENNKLPQDMRINFQKKLRSRLEALEEQVSDILMYARSGEQTVTTMDAVDLVENVSSSVCAVVKRFNAEFSASIGPRPMMILGNVNALSGALGNLVTNACEAGATKVELSLYEENDEICFSVANNGPTIDDKFKQKIFEPFFTTKSNGTGLGLAVVSAVASVHQGKLCLGSKEGFSVVFTLRIPKSKIEGKKTLNDEPLAIMEGDKAA